MTHGLLSFRGPIFMVGARNLLCFQSPYHKQILRSAPDGAGLRSE
jgi:hypothetical protein